MKNRKTNFIMLMLSSVLCFTACDNPAGQASVKIGQQEWTSKNLNVATFRNGDAIPQARTNEEWKNAGNEYKPAWCYYDNDPKNGDKYGKLYNWYAVTDPRGLAPSGWHVPSDAEWTKLTDYLGGEDVAGNKMKSNNGWGDNGSGSNESGFSGLPGGYRYNEGTFNDIGIYGYWWSSTQTTPNFAVSRSLFYGGGDVDREHYSKSIGYSVRCFRD